MNQTGKKLLILADDHPHVRSALERLVRDLREHIALYSAEHPKALQPLASKRIAEAQLLTFADIRLDPARTSPEAPAEHAPDASGQDSAPLMVVSTQEQGITASWIVAMPGGDAAHERVRFEDAINQRAVALDLIRSLNPSEVPASTDKARPPEPNLEALLRAGLTQRQAEVLLLLADGLANKEIARKLNVSEWTVRHHVSAILERLEVSNRGRAAQLARQLGYA